MRLIPTLVFVDPETGAANDQIQLTRQFGTVFAHLSNIIDAFMEIDSKTHQIALKRRKTRVLPPEIYFETDLHHKNHPKHNEICSLRLSGPSCRFFSSSSVGLSENGICVVVLFFFVCPAPLD